MELVRALFWCGGLCCSDLTASSVSDTGPDFSARLWTWLSSPSCLRWVTLCRLWVLGNVVWLCSSHKYCLYCSQTVVKHLFEKVDFFSKKSAQLSVCSDPELSFCACICGTNRMCNQLFCFMDINYPYWSFSFCHPSIAPALFFWASGGFPVHIDPYIGSLPGPGCKSILGISMNPGKL